MEYSIRFANVDDISQIMCFINSYWKKNHILGTNRELFEWQYCSDKKVNMVIGLDDNQQIQGVLGYIPYSNTEEKDFALSLWKVKEGTAFLGVKLLLFLLDNEPHRYMFCN